MNNLVISVFIILSITPPLSDFHPGGQSSRSNFTQKVFSSLLVPHLCKENSCGWSEMTGRKPFIVLDKSTNKSKQRLKTPSESSDNSDSEYLSCNSSPSTSRTMSQRGGGITNVRIFRFFSDKSTL